MHQLQHCMECNYRPINDQEFHDGDAGGFKLESRGRTKVAGKA